MKNTLIFVLSALLLIACYRLVVVENQRHALEIGLCPGKLVAHVPDLECVKRSQTRTGWAWHLYYALFD